MRMTKLPNFAVQCQLNLPLSQDKNLHRISQSLQKIYVAFLISLKKHGKISQATTISSHKLPIHKTRHATTGC